MLAFFVMNFTLTRNAKRGGFNVVAVEVGHMKPAQVLKKAISISYVTFVFDYFLCHASNCKKVTKYLFCILILH